MDNYQNEFEGSYNPNPLDEIDINAQLDGGYGNSNNEGYKQYAPLEQNNMIIPKRQANPNHEYDHNTYKKNMYGMDTNLVQNNTNKTNNSNKFYQICLFPDPKTKRYSVKRFIYKTDIKTGISKFVSVSQIGLTAEQHQSFLYSLKPHQYNTFSTYDLSDVDPPKLADVLINSSELLNNDYDYSGYAPY
jgi:hypothetical protein